MVGIAAAPALVEPVGVVDTSIENESLNLLMIPIEEALPKMMN